MNKADGLPNPPQIAIYPKINEFNQEKTTNPKIIAVEAKLRPPPEINIPKTQPQIPVKRKLTFDLPTPNTEKSCTQFQKQKSQKTESPKQKQTENLTDTELEDFVNLSLTTFVNNVKKLTEAKYNKNQNSK